MVDDNNRSQAGVGRLVDEPSGRRTLLQPPPGVPIGSQVTITGAGQVAQFYSYHQTLSARLPNENFTRLSGIDGTVMTGEFPEGVGGEFTDPFRAVLPRRNHHLLLIRRQ